MSDDMDYLAKYKVNQLYVSPASKGAYATIAGESEEPVGEVEITSRCKLAVSAFYVRDKGDFNSLKIKKLRWHKRLGWQEDGHIQVNQIQAAQMIEFLSIISHLDLTDAQKAKLSLDNLHVGTLGAILGSSKGAAVLKELAESPELNHDIYAVAAKRVALAEFESMLSVSTSEKKWQAYFERNPWVFGHGLNYVFLDKVARKLEARTTGSAFDRPGKTADGLMRTRAAVSQFVLIETKRHDTELLQGDPYRSGCWAVSNELSSAVTQTQKTRFEFIKDHFREQLKDGLGNDTGELTYSVEPKSYLIIGNLTQLAGNDDKIACFELYRHNIHSPEILTFDELFYRARCIVENISHETGAPSSYSVPDADVAADDSEIPF